MYDLKILAERLKATRIANNLTQRQLADKAKMTSATISAYEKGAKNPSLENVANLSCALNTSIDWLCGNDDSKINEPQTYADVIFNLTSTLSFIDYDIVAYELAHEPDIYNIEIKDDILIPFIRELKSLQLLIEEAEAEAEAEAIKDQLKNLMGDSEELRAGEYKISYKTVETIYKRFTVA